MSTTDAAKCIRALLQQSSSAYFFGFHMFGNNCLRSSMLRGFCASLLLLLVAGLGCSASSSQKGAAPERTIAPIASPTVRPSEDPTVKDANTPDPRGAAIRDRSLSRVLAAGFEPASSLPTAGRRAFLPGELRPKAEIARRLLALQALVLWVAAPEDAYPSEEIRAYATRNRLAASLTAEELEMFGLSREAARQHSGTIGWRMENMWPLAWMLGFEKVPSITHGQVSGEIMVPMLEDFLPALDESLDSFAVRVTLRPLDEVAQLEDEFYCTHNAVRSAQLGNLEVVPEGFDPIAEGGTIHERRHSLSWSLSPEIDWDDTDLST